MSKHTPGPWRRGARTECHHIYASGGRICSIDGITRGRRVNPRHMEASANARLIAAAPDLLEALLAAYQSMSHRKGDCYSDDYMGLCCCGKDKAKAAINKAFGRPKKKA